MKRHENYVEAHTHTYSFNEQPAKLAGELVCQNIRRNIKYS